MKKTIALYSLFLTTLLSFQNAHGQDLGRVNTDLKAEHQQMTWIYDSGKNRYNLDSATTHVTGTVTGVGAFAGTNKAIDETHMEIIGKEIKGQMFMQLKNNNEQVAVNIGIELNDIIKFFPVRAKTSFLLPGKITNGGTWNDYLDGKPLQIKVSQDGAAEYNSQMSDFLKVLLSNAIKRYGNNPVSNNIKSVQLINGFNMTVDDKKIVIDNMITDYKLSLILDY